MKFKMMMMATVAFTAFAQTGVAQADEIVTLPGPSSTERVYGNGASLPAPYFRQAADCYSIKYPLIFTGNPPTSQNIDDFDYTGQPTQNCAATDYITNRQIRYMSTGSGTGIIAFYSHDPARAGDTDPAAGVQLFPRINYALSETSLGTAEVNAYNNGGTVQGITVVAPGVAPAAGQYDNPAYHRGAMIQFPILIAPVTIAYDPVYKKVRNGDGSVTELSFNNRWERADSTGGLHLDQPAICGIFNGDITTWTNSAFQALNKNTSLRAPGDSGSIPLQIVGRKDSSGTTSLWTRFLANACSGYVGNSYGNSTSRLPGTYRETNPDGSVSNRTTATLNKDLVGAVWDKGSNNFGGGRVFQFTTENGNTTNEDIVGKYTIADGNDGVAKYIDFAEAPGATAGDTVIQGRIGYVGPDYVLPGVLFTGQNSYGLKTADVQSLSGVFFPPNAIASLSAFKAILPPETNSAGVFAQNATCGTVGETGKCRKNPQDWVEPADKASPLANPAAAAYPIVGTSNFLGYSCYTKAFSQRTLTSFLGGYYLSSKTVNDITLGLLGSSGFAPLPSAWRKAMKQTFFDGTDGLGLAMSHVEAGGAAKCQAGAFGARQGG